MRGSHRHDGNHGRKMVHRYFKHSSLKCSISISMRFVETAIREVLLASSDDAEAG